MFLCSCLGDEEKTPRLQFARVWDHHGPSFTLYNTHASYWMETYDHLPRSTCTGPYNGNQIPLRGKEIRNWSPRGAVSRPAPPAFYIFFVPRSDEIFVHELFYETTIFCRDFGPLKRTSSAEELPYMGIPLDLSAIWTNLVYWKYQLRNSARQD